MNNKFKSTLNQEILNMQNKAAHYRKLISQESHYKSNFSEAANGVDQQYLNILDSSKLKKEKNKEIQSENLKLITRLHQIIQQKKVQAQDVSKTPAISYGIKSLNFNVRKKETQKIYEDNLSLLKRLKHSKPQVPTVEHLREHSEKTDYLVSNIREYNGLNQSKKKMALLSVKSNKNNNERSFSHRRIRSCNTRKTANNSYFTPIETKETEIKDVLSNISFTYNNNSGVNQGSFRPEKAMLANLSFSSKKEEPGLCSTPLEKVIKNPPDSPIKFGYLLPEVLEENSVTGSFEHTNLLKTKENKSNNIKNKEISLNSCLIFNETTKTYSMRPDFLRDRIRRKLDPSKTIHIDEELLIAQAESKASKSFIQE